MVTRSDGENCESVGLALQQNLDIRKTTSDYEIKMFF